jgi:uncharacterized protein (TIGR00290 family)
MIMREKTLFTWSGGKDSALALAEILKDMEYDIVALVTTITTDYDRVSMHGVRRVLLEEQAASLGFPLEEVFLSKDTSMENYGLKMRQMLEKYRDAGVSTVAFGDIFLEDVRKYREDNLLKIGMKALFPLWKKDTRVLAHSFIKSGFKAIVTCVDSTVLDKTFVGKKFDTRFLSCLPSSVDPCGENGEFHSFVFDGPIFHTPIRFTKGEIVLRDNRFYYCDLLPIGSH